MMIVAFAAGILLQLAVIELPGVIDVFKTVNLDWKQWLITLLLSLVVVFGHEIVVLIKFIIRKKKEK